MIIFEAFINFIEALFYSFFIGNYFNLDKKKKFIIISTLIQWLMLEIADYTGNNGIELSLLIISFEIILVSIFIKKLSFNTMYIVFLYNSFIMIAAVITLFICLPLLNIPITVLPIVGSIISKAIQAFITIFIIKKDFNLSVSFDFKNWGLLILLDISILSILVWCTYCKINNVNYGKLGDIWLFLSFSITILYRLAIKKLNQINQDKLDLEKERQNEHLKDEKIKLLTAIKYENDALLHNLFYVLFGLETTVKNSDYEKIEETITKYKEYLFVKKKAITTGNEVLDYFYSSIVNSFLIDGTTIESIIVINERDYYNSMEFIGLILDLLNSIKESKLIKVIMTESVNHVHINIIYEGVHINTASIEKIMMNHLPYRDNWIINVQYDMGQIKIVKSYEEDN